VTGVIQAGGLSARMGGRPKALLELGGRRIIERVVDAVRGEVDDLLIVTNTPDRYAFLGLPMVPDAFPGGGPLGGICTGVAAATGEAAFTVACDMPFLDAGVVRLVVERAGQGDVVVPRAGDQLQTMHAIYRRACLPAMQEQLRAGRLRITSFFDRVGVVEVAESEVARLADPAIVFMNVNTPEELARARGLAGG
jgi:molybdenum cofactor guanylyltransferase